MGCCLGTTNQHPHHHPNGPNNRHFHARSSVTELDPIHIQKTQLRASTPPPPPPPPPVVEEESVKEVLSETPISKPKSLKYPKTKRPICLRNSKESFPIFLRNPNRTHPFSSESPGRAHPFSSESPGRAHPCSSQTPSRAAQGALRGAFSGFRALWDAREDEATSKRKRDVGHRDRASGPSSTTARCKRPYSGELAGRREKGVKLPATAPEPPMGKRNRIETRSSRGRESGQLRTMQRGAGPTGVRRDAVSSRSRSPATRTAGGAGRAAVGRSPAKVTGRAAAGGSSLQQGAVEREGKQIKKEAEPSNDGVSQPQKQGNESLELECFIFIRKSSRDMYWTGNGPPRIGGIFSWNGMGWAVGKTKTF
ncbi:pollen-specific leucine-rich repeat extensin-like protein 2 [Prunus yedoensis var. nudiflora]|uniref:Pollen-specific leucine-rich repeat extensin-like protein 2 n=1 Tax=Prunus yedoensis var. nudiflora TaxID=2094558 RepID=A0A314UWK1_PRUYE|nr:pollen-specific leucine-rich repeat extensin-like protein 2 [Prunus yedoensis var. nudiflora]